jgi:hypothetical protein
MANATATSVPQRSHARDPRRVSVSCPDSGHRRPPAAARPTRLIGVIRKLLPIVDQVVVTAVVAGISLAHVIVLYKIDTGLRSNELTPAVTSRSHRNFW